MFKHGVWWYGCLYATNISLTWSILSLYKRYTCILPSVPFTPLAEVGHELFYSFAVGSKLARSLARPAGRFGWLARRPLVREAYKEQEGLRPG